MLDKSALWTWSFAIQSIFMNEVPKQQRKKKEKDYSLIDKAAVTGSQNSRDAFGTECLLCVWFLKQLIRITFSPLALCKRPV